MGAIVLFASLRSARTRGISRVAIPLSRAVTTLAFKVLVQPINAMTLGGLTIAVGELVSDAVVDVEKLVRKLQAEACGAGRPLFTMKGMRQASRATRERGIEEVLIERGPALPACTCEA
ncbi:efflux RND transporter permease subunit [Variovorax sp. RCC_210]|uniref:efflux RND transporter permease subunit n=1 Tax=Variovorax sp. RCC_210 TaxID=3239217 RepID=UPI003523A62B